MCATEGNRDILPPTGDTARGAETVLRLASAGDDGDGGGCGTCEDSCEDCGCDKGSVLEVGSAAAGAVVGGGGGGAYVWEGGTNCDIETEGGWVAGGLCIGEGCTNGEETGG